MLPISNNCGLPVCLSGISHPLGLHKEMKDHDRRREAMKNMKFQENILQGYEIFRTQNREGYGRNSDVINGDGIVKIQDLSCISLPRTAKAA